MTYVKVNGTLYPAEIAGRMNDTDWDGRESKAIHAKNMTYEQAVSLFQDGTEWSIVQTYEELAGHVDPETGEAIPVPPDDEWDNSEFSLAGDVTDHRDGSCTIKMGKLTAFELFMMAMV